jgi:hypothetical protein
LAPFTTAVAVVAGGVAGLLTAALARREEKKRRIREEVVRWSNPIFGAVDSLHYRIGNILDGVLGPALASNQRDVARPVDPDWSVDHEYAPQSTLFLFGQYFAWIRLLQQETRFDLYPSDDAKETFCRSVHAVDSLCRTGRMSGWSGAVRTLRCSYSSSARSASG